MTVAAWQRLGVGAAVLALVGWLWVWRSSPLGVLAGLCVIGAGMWWAQAAHSLLAAWVGRGAPRPPGWPAPTWRSWWLAWWRESWLALRVFAWWQPFRAAAVPDGLGAPADAPGRTGVVLVHGYLCNRALWTGWLRRFRAEGRPVVAVTLEPVFGDIDAYAPAIERAVQAMTAHTGRRPLLVGHSMGGLAARAWWRTWRQACVRAGEPVPALADRVCGIVTLGTPHQGTWLARFSRTANGRQMRMGSRWLQALSADEPPAQRQRIECWSAACDGVVYPPGVAELDGAPHRRVDAVGHLGLIEAPEVWQAVQAHLRQADQAAAQGANPGRLSCFSRLAAAESRENPYISPMARDSSVSRHVRAPIRTLGVEHRPAILKHLLALGERDRYLRFGYAATDEHIRRYVERLRFDCDEVFGIFNWRMQLIAMAHLAYMVEGQGRHSAEFGVSVAPHARGRGYGEQLFARAVRHARNEGVTRLIIHALSENAAMLAIARKGGATVVRDGSESQAHLELPPADFESNVTELLEEQVARSQYWVKLGRHRLRQGWRRLAGWSGRLMRRGRSRV